MRSALLSRFWGRDIFLTAHVLVPRDFDKHPEARFPLMIFHGHFPADFGGFRTTPPDPDLKCQPSERFNLPCYNRTEQEEAYAFYQQWIGDKFPRFLAVEIDHSNPYYDDSYAVNSANLGPYGDAITHELVPAIEKEFRGLGQGWARFLYGGSTGGWESLGVQIKYPDDYNGAFAACPDPIDFRQFMLTDIYADKNAYAYEGPFGRVDIPASATGWIMCPTPWRWKIAWNWCWVTEPLGRAVGHLGSGVLTDGRRRLSPTPVGQAHRRDRSQSGRLLAREHDLRYMLERDWPKLAPKLQGKLHIYVGTMDNFFLNNAVYLMDDFLKKSDPPYRGVVDYGDRAEHCWSGDHAHPNAIARLRYHTFYTPRSSSGSRRPPRPAPTSRAGAIDVPAWAAWQGSIDRDHAIDRAVFLRADQVAMGDAHRMERGIDLPPPVIEETAQARKAWGKIILLERKTSGAAPGDRACNNALRSWSGHSRPVGSRNRCQFAQYSLRHAPCPILHKGGLA
jgi:hypothetical protein